VYVLPQREARRRLATTNSIEHDHMAVRRRTAVVRVFPNEASFLGPIRNFVCGAYHDL
jgi:transposase-like protein